MVISPIFTVDDLPIKKNLISRWFTYQKMVISRWFTYQQNGYFAPFIDDLPIENGDLFGWFTYHKMMDIPLFCGFPKGWFWVFNPPRTGPIEACRAMSTGPVILEERIVWRAPEHPLDIRIVMWCNVNNTWIVFGDDIWIVFWHWKSLRWWIWGTCNWKSLNQFPLNQECKNPPMTRNENDLYNL